MWAFCLFFSGTLSRLFKALIIFGFGWPGVTDVEGRLEKVTGRSLCLRQWEITRGGNISAWKIYDQIPCWSLCDQNENTACWDLSCPQAELHTSILLSFIPVEQNRVLIWLHFWLNGCPSHSCQHHLLVHHLLLTPFSLRIPFLLKGFRAEGWTAHYEATMELQIWLLGMSSKAHFFPKQCCKAPLEAQAYSLPLNTQLFWSEHFPFICKTLALVIWHCQILAWGAFS